MKKIFSIIAVTFVFASCGNENYPPAENGLVASQYFLDACLKGDFKQAQFYIVSDSANLQKLTSLKKQYYQYSSEQRQEYRTASIIIQKDSLANDSTEYIKCQNSYDKKLKEIKVKKLDGNWKIDL